MREAMAANLAAGSIGEGEGEARFLEGVVEGGAGEDCCCGGCCGACSCGACSCGGRGKSTRGRLDCSRCGYPVSCLSSSSTPMSTSSEKVEGEGGAKGEGAGEEQAEERVEGAGEEAGSVPVVGEETDRLEKREGGSCDFLAGV